MMDETGFNIARSKFYGYQPDENTSLKQNSKIFYGGISGLTSPSRRYENNQENIAGNVSRNRRSSIGRAGKSISNAMMHRSPSHDIISNQNLSPRALQNRIPPKKVNYQ